MRALFYTLILSAVLVGLIILQLTTGEKKTATPTPNFRSIGMKSAPIPLKTFDVSGFDSSTVGEIYLSGSLLLELWHDREATQTIEAAARRDSSHFATFTKLVECYSRPLICREDEARAAWKQARKIAAGRNPRDTVFVNAMGFLFLSGDYSSAAPGFEKFVDDPDLGESAEFYLATTFYRMGKLERAEQSIEKLLKIDESNGPARELLIKCAAARSDLDEAERLAKDLAVLYSEESYPYVLLSRVEMLRGDEEDALAFCENALALDARYIPAILCKGNLYAARGQSEAARATFEKLLLFDDPMLASIGYESIAYVDFLWGRFEDGGDMMDEAIRNAILVGSVRRGLYDALRLVDYLCRLGQVEKAHDVVERWFGGFGEIPLELARLKLDICEGNVRSALQALGEIDKDRKRRTWMRWIGFDVRKEKALANIKNGRFETALAVLDSATVDERADEERAYLEGHAAFENGDAELAAKSFATVLEHPRGLDFPYHHDPVLYVQALFYLAETSMAAGDTENAVTYYEKFIDHWGGSSWEMQAVARARDKLHTLTGISNED